MEQQKKYIDGLKDEIAKLEKKVETADQRSERIRRESKEREKEKSKEIHKLKDEVFLSRKRQSRAPRAPGVKSARELPKVTVGL